jgi:anaerobic selenocysteine-containing dehydrogenase
LIDKPSGVDLGELQPCMPERLVHEDKTIQLAPPLLVNDVERLKKLFDTEPVTAAFPMLLIGRRHLRDNNSWLHNSAKLMKGHHRCTLMMHPNDAKNLNIIDKMRVNVTSRVGNITVLAEITDDMMQGVVSLPHGYGHTRKGTRLDIAEQHAGANVNDLTDELVLDDLTGNAAFSNVMVRVEHI